MGYCLLSITRVQSCSDKKYLQCKSLCYCQIVLMTPLHRYIAYVNTMICHSSKYAETLNMIKLEDDGLFAEQQMDYLGK